MNTKSNNINVLENWNFATGELAPWQFSPSSYPTPVVFEKYGDRYAVLMREHVVIQQALNIPAHSTALNFLAKIKVKALIQPNRHNYTDFHLQCQFKTEMGVFFETISETVGNEWTPIERIITRKVHTDPVILLTVSIRVKSPDAPSTDPVGIYVTDVELIPLD